MNLRKFTCAICAICSLLRLLRGRCCADGAGAVDGRDCLCEHLKDSSKVAVYGAAKLASSLDCCGGAHRRIFDSFRQRGAPHFSDLLFFEILGRVARASKFGLLDWLLRCWVGCLMLLDAAQMAQVAQMPKN